MILEIMILQIVFIYHMGPVSAIKVIYKFVGSTIVLFREYSQLRVCYKRPYRKAWKGDLYNQNILLFIWFLILKFSFFLKLFLSPAHSRNCNYSRQSLTMTTKQIQNLQFCCKKLCNLLCKQKNYLFSNLTHLYIIYYKIRI